MSIRQVAALAGVSPATVSARVHPPRRRRCRTPGVASWPLRTSSSYSPIRSPARWPGAGPGTSASSCPTSPTPSPPSSPKRSSSEARRDGYALFVAGSDGHAQDEEYAGRGRWPPRSTGCCCSLPGCPMAALLALAGITPVVMTNRELDGLPADPSPASRPPGTPSSTCTRSATASSSTWRDPQGYSNDVRLRGFRDACAGWGSPPRSSGRSMPGSRPACGRATSSSPPRPPASSPTTTRSRWA